MTVVLIKDIEFHFEGNDHYIPQGTEIFIDTAKNIGYYNNQHFDCFPDEYKVLH